MKIAISKSTAPSVLRWFAGDRHLAGRLTLSWALAGGLTMEAILVMAAFTSGNPISASDPFTASLFFLGGAAGGLVHGALVGAAGRPESVSLAQAVRSIEGSLLLALPGLAFAWLVAIWTSMTATAVESLTPWMLLGVATAWLITLVVSIWALLEAQAGLTYALQRWPERRPGRVLVGLTFGILVVAFVWLRPEIWFTDLRPSALGAVFLALGATIWIALPVLVFLLHFLHQWRSESPIWDDPSTPAEQPGPGVT